MLERRQPSRPAGAALNFTRDNLRPLKQHAGHYNIHPTTVYRARIWPMQTSLPAHEGQSRDCSDAAITAPRQAGYADECFIAAKCTDAEAARTRQARNMNQRRCRPTIDGATEKTREQPAGSRIRWLDFRALRMKVTGRRPVVAQQRRWSSERIRSICHDAAGNGRAISTDIPTVAMTKST